MNETSGRVSKNETSGRVIRINDIFVMPTRPFTYSARQAVAFPRSRKNHLERKRPNNKTNSGKNNKPVQLSNPLKCRTGSLFSSVSINNAKCEIEKIKTKSRKNNKPVQLSNSLKCRTGSSFSSVSINNAKCEIEKKLQM